LVKDTSVLEFSEVLLELFRMTSLQRFGREIESFTFHLTVKHLVNNVKLHGSLIGHSMFSLEGSLGFFNSTLNGNVNLSEQYVKSNISK
jgi:hypothetical protein